MATTFLPQTDTNLPDTTSVFAMLREQAEMSAETQARNPWMSHGDNCRCFFCK